MFFNTVKSNSIEHTQDTRYESKNGLYFHSNSCVMYDDLYRNKFEHIQYLVHVTHNSCSREQEFVDVEMSSNTVNEQVSVIL